MSDLTQDFVIDDTNYLELVTPQIVDGETKGFGLIPRDYSRFGVGYYDKVVPFNQRLIPRTEWSTRIKDMEQAKSRLSDLCRIGNQGGHIKSLDQNGQGYCWAYSPAAAIIAVRARDNQPYVRLSAHAVGCKIKNFRDQGGWGAQAVEYAIKHGYPDVNNWAEKSMSRSYDTATTWENASHSQVIDGWMDLTPAAYDRNLSFDQFMTCLFDRCPCTMDVNWWGHSICALDPVEVDNSLQISDPRRWGVRIWNSWTDSWGTLGMGVLVGNKAIPDGATCVRGVEQVVA